MSRRLNANVIVRNPATGSPAVFVAGDPVPDWAAELITNPDVWASMPDVGAGVAPEPTPEHDEQQPDGSAATPADTVAPEQPPVKGPGSSKAAWVAYAASQGIDVGDRSKAEIIALFVPQED